MKKIAITLFIAAVGGLVAIGGYRLTEAKKVVSFQEDQKVNYVRVADHSPLSSAGLADFTAPAAEATPAVVHITTTYRASKGSDEMFDLFGDFFGGAPQQRGPQKAFGSGVIISSDGYIVTNNHVIEDANNIEVVLDNKKSFRAKMIGTDPTTDIALLKINGDNLPILRFGNSDKVRVGEWVLAVGNPFNLTSTVTAGIVSAKGRNINILGGESRENGSVNTSVEAFIQTDAAVNRGNSGGALVNTNGELVGINSAIASGSGNYEGYSFAVPVNLVKKVVDDLRNYGTVQRGYLGVNIQEITADFVKDKNLNDKDIRGVYVAKVESNSAAEASGVLSGDIITKIQGIGVNSNSELTEQVARYRPGDVVSVTVLRAGEEKVFRVVLKNRRGDTRLVKKEVAINTNHAANIETQALSKQELGKFGIPFGVRITHLGDGVFKDMGVKPGFIILRINDQDVKTAQDVDDALNSANNTVALEGIYPDTPNIIRNYQRSARN